MDAEQPAGWTTRPAPFFLGEDEEHPLADVDYLVAGAIDEGVTHRRAVGLYPPEVALLPCEDALLPDDV